MKTQYVSKKKKWDIPLAKIVNESSGHINRSIVSIMWEVIVLCLALIIPYLVCVLLTIQIVMGLHLFNIISLVSFDFIIIFTNLIQCLSVTLLNLSPVLPSSTTSIHPATPIIH